MNIGIILIAVGCFGMGFGGALMLMPKTSVAEVEAEVVQALTASEVVEAGPFENIEALPRMEYNGIHWLESRTHFSSNGAVIVAYDPFYAAVAEVDRLIGECRPLR